VPTLTFKRWGSEGPGFNGSYAILYDEYDLLSLCQSLPGSEKILEMVFAKQTCEGSNRRTVLSVASTPGNPRTSCL
jgi:hypothetical protein